MKIIFEAGTRRYEAKVEDIEEIYEAVRDGLIAMSYHEDTANKLIEELKNGNNLEL